jgi:glycosyltransferase involved in cell wall biosynthesis
VGGLGLQCANALSALALHHRVHAIGPAFDEGPAATGRVTRHPVPPPVAAWRRRWTWLRWLTGRGQLAQDRGVGRRAAASLEQIRPSLVYAFTQVALESLVWARRSGALAVLESPNGHIANFDEVLQEESRRWCGSRHLGHPAPAMVERVVAEYAAADFIRVSSEWSRSTLVSRGVSPSKIVVLQQSVDLGRFAPPERPAASSGPLRVCFVGALDLRKGFVYLLRAARRLGRAVQIELVGATGSRCCRKLLERESAGLDVVVKPGSPLPALQRAEVFVLPTLEDGSPFAVAEAMASGLPVIVGQDSGASEWIRPGETGWIVPSRDEDALAAALQAACEARPRLGDMGRRAREDTERRADPVACATRVHEWLVSAAGHTGTGAA